MSNERIAFSAGGFLVAGAAFAFRNRLPQWAKAIAVAAGAFAALNAIHLLTKKKVEPKLSPFERILQAAGDNVPEIIVSACPSPKEMSDPVMANRPGGRLSSIVIRYQVKDFIEFNDIFENVLFSDAHHLERETGQIRLTTMIREQIGEGLEITGNRWGFKFPREKQSVEATAQELSTFLKCGENRHYTIV